MSPPTEEDMLLTETDLWGLVVEEMGDDEIAAEVEKCRRAAAKKKYKQELHRAQARPGSAGGSSSSDSVPASKARLPFVDGRGLSRDEAKPLFPPGTFVSKDSHAVRWQARQKWLTPSVSRAFTAGSHRTDDEALKAVLRETWRVYTRKFGVECPWDLDDVLFQ